MYQRTHLSAAAPPFGAPQRREPPPTPGGFTGGPTGHLPSLSPHNKPHVVRPQCSSYPVDYYTMIGLGRSHQRVPQWGLAPAPCPPPDVSERASEEFLRCISANEPLPNMKRNLADAFKSAPVKEAPTAHGHLSRSRGKSHARSRSRGKSHARSRSRGKSHARSRSRAKSPAYSRSRGRSKSHARDKSALRESGRSGSWSQNRTWISSPTQSRTPGQRSSSGSEKDQDKTGSGGRSSVDKDENPTGSCLLKGLKVVLHSKELEERFSHLKDAFLGIKAFSESKAEMLFLGGQQKTSATGDDLIILPHDRVGSDFSWLQAPTQKKPGVQKDDGFQAEESFLYGNKDTAKASRRLGSAQEPEEERLLASAPTARPLESSFSKATQERCPEQGEAPAHSPAGKHKVDEEEERGRLKRATTSKMESLMKELETLMTHNGFPFLTPVIGFYCRKCEEFFGDWNSAESHAAMHCCPWSTEVRLDKCDGNTQRYPSDRTANYHSNPGEQAMDGDWREEQELGNRHRSGLRSREENLFLEEEMKKERMLITVSQEPGPPSHANLRKDLQAAGMHSQVRTADKLGTNCSSEETTAKAGNCDKDKTKKTKSHKKKKKRDGKKKNKKS